MASSGSYDFSVSRDEIVTMALQHISAVGDGITPSSTQITEASRLLNMIVKLRETDGMPIWALKRGTILPFTGTPTINTDSHVVTTFRQTTLGAAAAAAATSLTVASITGFVNGDQIGIELTNGDVQWTTINGVPAGTTIVITTGLTSAAASGLYVYGYTASSNRIQKPLRITQANVRNIVSSTTYEVTLDDRATYYGLGSRLTAEGTPNQIYYDLGPSSDTALETNGKLNVFPLMADGKTLIEFTYVRPFQDFDATGDTPDFPQAFYLPLMLELAWLLSPKHGVPGTERKSLQVDAQYYLEKALESTYPEGSIFIQPTRPYGR